MTDRPKDQWELFNEFNQLKTLHVTVGLPYAGKSTWCRLTGRPIVSPDAIRLSLHDTRFNTSGHLAVWTIAQYMVQALFIAGHSNVIVDGCHISKKRRDIWRSNAGAGRNARWITHFHTFTTPIAVCLGRAASRRDQRIMAVIDRMHNQWEDVCDDDVESEDFVPGAETIHDYDAQKDICIPVEKAYKGAGAVQQEVGQKAETATVEGQENPQGHTQGEAQKPEPHPDQL